MARTAYEWLVKIAGVTELQMPEESVTDDLQAAEYMILLDHSCVGTLDGGVTLTGAKLDLYYQAQALWTAADLFGTGGTGGTDGNTPRMVTRKMGDVTYTFKMIPPEDREDGWMKRALRLLTAICQDDSSSLDNAMGSGGLVRAANPSRDTYGYLRQRNGRRY